MRSGGTDEIAVLFFAQVLPPSTDEITGTAFGLLVSRLMYSHSPLDSTVGLFSLP